MYTKHVTGVSRCVISGCRGLDGDCRGWPGDLWLLVTAVCVCVRPSLCLAVCLSPS